MEQMDRSLQSHSNKYKSVVVVIVVVVAVVAVVAVVIVVVVVAGRHLVS